MLVVEHNTEVIKTADWIIDLGPEGGEAGGQIVAAGTPEEVAEGGGAERRRAERKVLASLHRPSARVRCSVIGTANRHPPPAARPLAAPAPRFIKVRGARQHNLKDVDVDIPRDRLTVCCGPSGSGKTSLAMDTIYAEGQRRYVESLSSYARQFVGQMQKPKVEHIEGLSPAVAIEQKHSGHSPRSTVGTVTEIYDYRRILMSRLGQPHCPACDVPIGSQSADEIIAKIMAHPAGTKMYLLAPLEIRVGEHYETLWDETRASGYVRIRVDGQTYSVDQPPVIDRRRKHDVEVVIDRVTVRADARSRIAGSVENALSLGRGVLRVVYPREDVPEPQWPVDTHSQHFVCDRCGRSFEPLSPHHFSFNSALGLVPGLRRAGRADRHESGRVAPRSEADACPGGGGLWPSAGPRSFLSMLEAFSRGTGIPTDVPFDEIGGRHGG